MHITTFYQYFAGCLLNSVMHLFFQIQSPLLLMFSIDDLEYVATLTYVMFCFHLYNH